MKIYSMIVGILLLNSMSIGQWEWQYPIPQGNCIRTILAFDNNNIYCAGNAGLFMKTSDAGNSWDTEFYIAGFDSLSFCSDLYFIDPLNGWAVGTRGKSGYDSGFVVKTTDGGSSWVKVPMDTLDETTTVYFLNENLGWIGTRYQKIFKTSDGGISWSTIITPSMSWAKDFYFLNSQLGFACTPFGIRKTTDGGLTWLRVSNLGAYKIYMYDYLVGWAWLDNFMKTMDGGNTWNRIGLNAADVYIKSSTNMRCIDERGRTYKSTNGGSNWVMIHDNWGKYDYEAYFLDTSNILLYKNAQIAKSTNFGLSWQIVTAESSVSLKSCKFVNDMVGWAVGGNKIMKTTSGGMSWIYQTQFSTIIGELYDIDFIDENRIFVSGDDGLIRKSTDGGDTWLIRDYGVSTSLRSIDILDEQNILIVGTGGVILKTTNNGEEWKAQYSNTSKYLYAVKYLTNELAYCAGQETFKKSTDGGSTWYDPGSFPLSICYSIDFLDSVNGFAVGQTDTLWRTSDGGVHWTSYILKDTQYHYWKNSSIIFASNNVGWISCIDQGAILKTTDGGVSWFRQWSNTDGRLEKIHPINEDICWAVGPNTILKTSNGGVNSVLGEDFTTQVLPIHFNLSQSYPNPFNPNTTIKYQLPENSKVSLKVYNTLGQVVITLTDKVEDAGFKSVEWNASNVASGVYFYRLEATSVSDPSKSFTQVKKMLLVK